MFVKAKEMLYEEYPTAAVAHGLRTRGRHPAVAHSISCLCGKSKAIEFELIKENELVTFRFSSVLICYVFVHNLDMIVRVCLYLKRGSRIN